MLKPNLLAYLLILMMVPLVSSATEPLLTQDSDNPAELFNTSLSLLSHYQGKDLAQLKYDLYFNYDKNNLEALKDLQTRLEAAVGNLSEPSATPSPEMTTLTVGGPDNYGYIMVDDQENALTNFNWDDVPSTPGMSQVLFYADFGQVVTTLPWAFPFYGNAYNNILVFVDGVIGFGDLACTDQQLSPGGVGQCAFFNYELPLTNSRGNFCLPTGAYVMPYYIDLAQVDVYRATYDVGLPTERVTFQWNGSLFYWGGTISFQVQLYKDGRIVYMYGDVSLPYDWDNGKWAIVGIQGINYGFGTNYLNYQACGDENVPPGRKIIFTIPGTYPCDIESFVMQGAYPTTMPTGNTINVTGNYINHSGGLITDVPVWLEIYNGSGLLLHRFQEVVDLFAGMNTVWFGQYYVDLREEYLKIVMGHDLDCDTYYSSELGNWHVLNNTDEQDIYVFGPAAYNTCRDAMMLPANRWAIVPNIGTFNYQEFYWVKSSFEPNFEPSPEAWMKFTAPENGYVTLSLRRSTMEPFISPLDVSVWYSIGIPWYHLAVTNTWEITYCDQIPNPIWDPTQMMTYDCGENVDPFNQGSFRSTVDRIYLYKGESVYYIIQRNRSDVPEHFFMDVLAEFTPYAKSQHYLGNNTCPTAYPVPDNTGDWRIEGSTLGATNNFWFLDNYYYNPEQPPYGEDSKAMMVPPSTPCYGQPIYAPFSSYELTSFNALAADVVFNVPVYENADLEIQVTPGSVPYQFADYFLTAYMMERCRGGDYYEHVHGTNIEPLCNQSARSQGWGDFENPTFGYTVPDDGDNWRERERNHWLVIDSWFRDPLNMVPYQGNFDLQIRKDMPCGYQDDIMPYDYADFEFIRYGQTIRIYDNSGRLHPVCQNDGGMDNRVWFLVTEQDVVNHFMGLAEVTPEWMDLGAAMTSNELVRLSADGTYYLNNDTLFVPDTFIKEFAHQERYWLDLGPFEQNHEFDWTFTQTTFIVLGISCVDCPGYKEKLMTIVVAPDPDPQTSAMILDWDRNDIGAEITVNLGETVALVGTGYCALQPDWDKMEYNWYENTRHQNVPFVADNMYCYYTATAPITYIILEAMCVDDPVRLYDEAFDTLKIIANKAKTPETTVELKAGEIKVAKAKFVGGVDALNIIYKPEVMASTSTLNIYDMRGRLLRTINGNGSELVDFTWDGKDAAGNILPSGTYVWKVQNAGNEKSGVTVLTR